MSHMREKIPGPPRSLCNQKWHGPWNKAIYVCVCVYMCVCMLCVCYVSVCMCVYILYVDVYVYVCVFMQLSKLDSKSPELN